MNKKAIFVVAVDNNKYAATFEILIKIFYNIYPLCIYIYIIQIDTQRFVQKENNQF